MSFTQSIQNGWKVAGLLGVEHPVKKYKSAAEKMGILKFIIVINKKILIRFIVCLLFWINFHWFYKRFQRTLYHVDAIQDHLDLSYYPIQ
jgi:hypothetical protein